MAGELVTVPRPAIIEAGGDEWWGMPASLHRSALRTHALATRCCVRTVSRSSGSRRTDSTVAGDEPKAGRLSRRHTSSSTSYPRTASSAMAPDISSAIGVPSALAPCVVFIRSVLQIGVGATARPGQKVRRYSWINRGVESQTEDREGHGRVSWFRVDPVGPCSGRLDYGLVTHRPDRAFMLAGSRRRPIAWLGTWPCPPGGTVLRR